MSIFYLKGSNDLATVPISAINIRLLVKQLFSFAKIQQFVGYTKKSMFFNDRCRQGLFKGFQRAFNKLSMNFKMTLKKARKMHKYAKTAFIKKEGAFCFFLVPTWHNKQKSSYLCPWIWLRVISKTFW